MILTYVRLERALRVTFILACVIWLTLATRGASWAILMGAAGGLVAEHYLCRAMPVRILPNVWYAFGGRDPNSLDFIIERRIRRMIGFGVALALVLVGIAIACHTR